MKLTKRWVMMLATVVPLLCALAQAPAPPAADLSAGTTQVVKLAQSGTSDDVLLAYVQNSASPFSLTADQIVYLKDVGLSSQVITAMISRDTALRGQPQAYDYTQQSYPPAAPGTTPPAPTVAEPVPSAPAPAPAAAPVYVSDAPADVSYFYGDLSPYGTWISLPGYGWCWQPTAVVLNTGWRPYCDAGHWAWTDAGWFWASDYSWGWAPFHYGRWYRHANCGWVWMPDRVWGPAWVTWRTGGDICGWAPLPPRASFDARLGWSFNGARVAVGFDFGLSADCFAFIGLRDFCAHDLGHRRLPPAEVTRVYRQTTVLNNYVVQNNRVVNQGLKVERVAAATHTEIHRATIKDLPAGAARASTGPGSERSTSVVYRAQPRAPSTSVKMVAQKLDERHPVVQHTEMAPAGAGRRTSPAVTAPPTQFQSPRTSPRPGNDKSGTGRPQNAAPGTDRTTPAPRSSAVNPGNSRPVGGAQGANSSATFGAPRQKVEPTETGARPTETARPTRTATTAKPAAPSVEDASATPRPVTSSRANNQRLTYPLQTSRDQAVTPGTAHFYYPKTYHQTSEVRALPAENAPPTRGAADRTAGARKD